MKPRQQRMLAVGLAALGIAIAAGFTLRAFQDNMMFFVDISDVVAGDYPKERNFRIGGLVVGGSVHRDEGSVTTACSWPTRFWPSTTRNTWRRKSQTRYPSTRRMSWTRP